MVNVLLLPQGKECTIKYLERFDNISNKSKSRCLNERINKDIAQTNAFYILTQQRHGQGGVAGVRARDKYVGSLSA